MQHYIEQYGTYIYHLAYLYVKDTGIAEEITQDVFYSFSSKKQQFRGEAQVKTYLTRIAINRSHDELRKIKRRILLEAVLPFMKTVQSAEHQVLKSVQGESLKEIVWSLPVHYREVIILHFYEEFSVLEITQLLNLSENTVRTRLRRGKSKLRELLGESIEGGIFNEQF